MSKSSNSKRKPVIDRPIDESVVRKAKKVARRYGLILRMHERLGFIAHALEMPTVFSSGEDPAECTEATYDALTVAVATMLEAGVRPPEPFAERKRKEQMNVRLDAEEKILLKETALQRGYRSVSDYVRAVALKDARKRPA